MYLAAGADEDSSAASDISGVSCASTRTFLVDDSSLVLETTENGVTRYRHARCVVNSICPSSTYAPYT